jgi:DNA topoisomerase VI subunit B
MPPKKISKDQLQQKSPAEFFAENKNIAGFDNVSGSVVLIRGEAQRCS